MVGLEFTIGSGRNGGTDFDVGTPTFKDLSYKGEIVGHVARSCRARRRTNVAGASERNGSREPTKATADNCDLELLETRG